MESNKTDVDDGDLRRPIAGTPQSPKFTGAALWSLLPQALMVGWLAYVGTTIWLHVAHSVQPPLYDPLGYMQKAMNFWQALDDGRIADALRAEPSVRPHGTVLMSYPFGFTPDYRGFHFRSAFLPIVCLVVAVYIAAGALRPKPAGGWWVASIAFLFSSLPLFYQFDWREETGGPVRWGLVDNFQAGVAAIATAALLRSLFGRSIPWLMLAAGAASLTLLVKPSGVMVMALIAFQWALAVAVEWGRRRPEQKTIRPELRRYGLIGAAAIAIIYLTVVAFCIYARYLSPSNFVYAKQALAIMQDILHFRWQFAANLFHKSSGAALVIWCVCILALLLLHLPAVRQERGDYYRFALVSAFGCLVMWVAGAWYWLVVQAGGNQIRYFYPFMLMGAICLIPAAVELWLNAGRAVRAAFVACCVLPAINVGALLASGDAPSVLWQKFSGVSVSVGEGGEEVAQANALLGELRQNGKDAALFSFGNGVPPAVFENVGMFEGTIFPGRPTFRVTTPHDWVRGWAVRMSELLESDFVLIRKYGDQDTKKILAPQQFDTSYTEALAFEAWLSTLDENSGVATVSDGTKLRVLRIVDRSKVEQAMDRFVSAHSWRPEFMAANRPIWWSADSLPESASNAVARNVDFGGVYKIHALALSRTEKEVTIDVWWQELRHEEANDQRFLFLHLVDSSGAILLNQQIPLFPYHPPDPRRVVRYARVKFNIELTLGRMTALGFGIYQPNGGYLVAESPASDYGGKRILIPLESPASRASRPSETVRP